ncbi:MAG: hypothetical protein Ct9H300mP20_17410 [Gammaproteobacteria bacterium]|nr:MAG: hypothetical protein Ct9H300mP20_17410 [Gammaproteobacteria bacterium]
MFTWELQAKLKEFFPKLKNWWEEMEEGQPKEKLMILLDLTVL